MAAWLVECWAELWEACSAVRKAYARESPSGCLLAVRMVYRWASELDEAWATESGCGSRWAVGWASCWVVLWESWGQK